MSAHQRKMNAGYAVIGVFQNKWQGETTAIQAFVEAKALAIQALNEKAAEIEALSFGDMKAKGFFVASTHNETTRNY